MDPRPKPRQFLGWYTVLVFLAALGWRLPYTLTVRNFFLDETAFAHPTIAQILAGEFPIYLYSNAYMAPVQEWLAAGLVLLMGESTAAVRLPCVLIGCLAIALTFLLLARMVKPLVALALVLPMICSNSYTGVYTAFGIPSYAIAMLCAVFLQAGALMVDRRRTFLAWAAFGVLGGLSAYVFKILAIQFGVALVWLFARSRSWREKRETLAASPPARAGICRGLIIAAVGMVAAALVAYRYLTRVETYQRSTLDMLLLAFGGVALLVAAWMGRGLFRARLSEWGAVTLCAGLALATYLPWEIYFVLHEKPRLAAEGIPLWEGSRYMLKHAHEWGFQVKLFLERVFSTVLVGRVNELGGGYATQVSLGWRTAVSAGFLILLLGGAAVRWVRGARPDWTSPRWLIVAPLIAVVVIMLPSWQLNNDWCGRYLLPFQAGLWMALYWVFSPWVDRHPRIAVALMGAYAVYCGLDTYWHTPT